MKPAKILSTALVAVALVGLFSQCNGMLRKRRGKPAPPPVETPESGGGGETQAPSSSGGGSPTNSSGGGSRTSSPSGSGGNPTASGPSSSGSAPEAALPGAGKMLPPAPFGNPDEVPIYLADRGRQSRPETPVRAGIPYGVGELSDAKPLELRVDGGDPVPVESHVLSRWPDGSVRWLGVEFLSPAVQSGATVRGAIGPRRNAQHEGAALTVSYGTGTSVDNGTIRLVDGGAGDEVFRIEGGSLSGPIKVDLAADLRDWDYRASGMRGDPATVEQQSDFSVTLHKRNRYVDDEGRDLFWFTTRATVFRGYDGVRLQHTMEVIRGTWSMRKWSLVMPTQGGGQARIATSNSPVNASGDFTHRQTSWRKVDRDGSTANSQMTGGITAGGVTVAVQDFWQLHPKGFQRSGNDLHVELCPKPGRRGEAVDHGFGRTHNLWVWPTSDAPSLSAADAIANFPVLPTTTAQRYCNTGALRRIGMPGGSRDIERAIEDGCERMFERWSNDPENHYGIQHYGDFFDREHTAAYWGHINQEYDAGLVLMQQFARTGDVSLLDKALVLSRHYADVDISHYGGVYQHRATMDHIHSWIGSIYADGYRKLTQKSPQYNGTTESFLRLVGKESKGLADRARELFGEYEQRLEGDEVEEMLFRLVAELELDGLLMKSGADRGAKGNKNPLLMVTERVAEQKRSKQLGFTNARKDFEEFFDIYGGSWDDFPSMHVDVAANPFSRHDGGHSLVESLVISHWLTADPRYREVCLRVADYTVNVQGPREIAGIQKALARDGKVYSRKLGWPLVNLCRVWEMTEGMPADAAALSNIRRGAADLSRAIQNITNYKRIQGSIHAGICMEGLASYHQLTNDRATANYLKKFARWWAENQYDMRNHGFKYQQDGDETAAGGFNGLCMMGLAYAEWLDHDPKIKRVLDDAWENLAAKNKTEAKTIAMLYRSAARAMVYMESK